MAICMVRIPPIELSLSQVVTWDNTVTQVCLVTTHCQLSTQLVPILAKYVLQYLANILITQLQLPRVKNCNWKKNTMYHLNREWCHLMSNQSYEFINSSAMTNQHHWMFQDYGHNQVGTLIILCSLQKLMKIKIDRMSLPYPMLECCCFNMLLPSSKWKHCWNINLVQLC